MVLKRLACGGVGLIHCVPISASVSLGMCAFESYSLIFSLKSVVTFLLDLKLSLSAQTLYA